MSAFVELIEFTYDINYTHLNSLHMAGQWGVKTDGLKVQEDCERTSTSLKDTQELCVYSPIQQNTEGVMLHNGL